jgi:hypothetical protein
MAETRKAILLTQHFSESLLHLVIFFKNARTPAKCVRGKGERGIRLVELLLSVVRLSHSVICQVLPSIFRFCARTPGSLPKQSQSTTILYTDWLEWKGA